MHSGDQDEFGRDFDRWCQRPPQSDAKSVVPPVRPQSYFRFAGKIDNWVGPAGGLFVAGGTTMLLLGSSLSLVVQLFVAGAILLAVAFGNRLERQKAEAVFARLEKAATPPGMVMQDRPSLEQ